MFFSNAKLGDASHEHLAARDNEERLGERETQGQQWLQGGAERLSINGNIIHSYVWTHEAHVLKFILKQP